MISKFIISILLLFLLGFLIIKLNKNYRKNSFRNIILLLIILILSSFTFFGLVYLYIVRVAMWCPNIEVIPTADRDFKNKAATEFILPRGEYVVVLDATKDRHIDGVTKFKTVKVKYSVQIPQSNINIDREEEIRLSVGPVNYIREKFKISKKANGTFKTEIVDPISEEVFIKLEPAGCYNSM